MQLLADGFEKRAVARMQQPHPAAAAANGHRVARGQIGLNLAVGRDNGLHFLAEAT